MTPDGPAPAPAPEWQRLDVRMLAVTPIRQLIGFLPVIAVVVVAGASGLGSRFYALLAGVVAVVAAGVLRWFTTRYRITDERVELRSGLLFRVARSIPRDRVRSVDLTAGPVHRLFALTVVTVGTGEQAELGVPRDLALDAVSAAEADRLRRALLERSAAPAATGDAPPDAPIAVLDWSWLRFAPLTVSSLAAVGGAVVALAQLAGELGVDPSDLARVGGARERLAAAPLWAALTGLGVLVLVVAVVGALLLFVEAWWGYRLAREPGGTLRVRRGLLTARSVSLEERRLRGVEVVEPLLLRAGRGARATAVATGLGVAAGQGRGALLPPAPRAEAHRVGGAVLRTAAAPTLVPLRRHPPAALRRRLLRAAAPVLVAAVATGWLARPSAGLLVLALLPVALLLAVDAYRSLGHALTPAHLVTRYGTGVRRTVALQRSGVIGWTVHRSVFQRRAGLVTVRATTAAGGGSYAVVDVSESDGLALADAALPGLLTSFLEGITSSARTG